MDTTHPGDQAAVRGLGGRRRGWGEGHAAGRRSTTLLISGRMVPGLLKGCFDIDNMSPSASPTLHPYLSIKISRTTSLHQHHSIYISPSPSLHSPSTSLHQHHSIYISAFPSLYSPSISLHLHLSTKTLALVYFLLYGASLHSGPHRLRVLPASHSSMARGKPAPSISEWKAVAPFHILLSAVPIHLISVTPVIKHLAYFFTVVFGIPERNIEERGKEREE